MADVFTVDSNTLDPTTDDFVPVRFSERFGTIPVLTLQRRGIALPGLPDPWIGKEATWEHDSNLYFVGDVVSATPTYTPIGWVITYQCLGLRNRLDWFPHTDATSGIDTSQFNLTLEDPEYNPALAGRTVGEILEAVLTMQANADLIDAHGMGGYTSLSPPTLPAATLADLAAMTDIPPRPVYYTGEKFGSSVDGLLQQHAPNHRFWVQPDGTFRFLDLRTFPPQTLTMGTDPIEPTELSRDVGDCFQRVVGRGQPIAIMGVLKQSLGQLNQNFIHDSYLTNAAAIAAWNPNQFRQAGTAQDVGTCTCPSTTTITVTSSNASAFWSSNFWDQSNQQGTVNLYSTTTPGVTQLWSARIVSNTALTAGGTSTLTIDSPLPHTAFDKYTLSGLSTGGSVVWTQYQIDDPDLWPKVVRQSTYPQPFISPGNGGATLISTALGVVLWSASGTAPFNSFPLAFTYNPNTGNIRFISPTYFVANNSAPSDVWVALPLQTNPNEAIEPPDSGGPVYAGTSHTVDGLEKTLTIDLPYWRDPGQLAQVQAYIANVLDSVKDATCEGSVVHYGLFEDALTFGISLNIAGDDGDGAYTTGWEGIDLAVIGVDLEWPQNDGMDYRTTMHCSNRRQALSASMFMHPAQQLGGFGMLNEGFNPFSIMQPEMLANSQGNYREAADLAYSGQLGQTQLSTGNQTSLGDSGITLDDVMAAGQPTGAGVRDRDTNPNRRIGLDTPEDQRSRVKQINEDDAAEKEAREAEINQAEKTRRDRMRRLGDTSLRMPKSGSERERIDDLGNHPSDTFYSRDLGNHPTDVSSFANLGKGKPQNLDAFSDLGKQESEAPDDRIRNLGKHPSDVSAYSNLGVKPPEDPEEAERIRKLGIRTEDAE